MHNQMKGKMMSEPTWTAKKYTKKAAALYLKELNEWRKARELKLFVAIAQDDDREARKFFIIPSQNSCNYWSTGSCSDSDHVTYDISMYRYGAKNSLILAK